MSSITPYINQEGWGKDLLDKLRKTIDLENGGIRRWEETPTTNNNGDALGIEDSGYTGINTSRGVIEYWDGIQWKTLLEAPLKVKGEASPPVEVEFSHEIVKPILINSDSIYAGVRPESPLTFKFRKINRDLTVEWTSTQSWATEAETPTGVNIAIEYDDKIVFGCQTGIVSGQNGNRLVCFHKETGVKIWDVPLTSGAVGSHQVIGLKVIGDSIYSVVSRYPGIYKNDKSNGTLQASNTNTTNINEASSRLCLVTNHGSSLFITYYSSTLKVFVYELSLDTLSNINFYEIPVSGYAQIFQLPNNSNIVNFQVEQVIYSYDLSSKSYSLSTHPELNGIVYGFTSSAELILTINGDFCFYYNNTYQLLAIGYANGNGVLSLTTQGNQIIYDPDDIALIKTLTRTQGRTFFQTKVVKTKASSRYIYFEYSAFATNDSLDQWKKEVNLGATYSPEITAEDLYPTNLYLPQFSIVDDADEYPNNLKRIQFQNGFDILQAVNMTGVTTNLGSSFVSGLTFNCTLTPDGVYRVFNSVYSGGVFFGYNKGLLLENSWIGASSEYKLTDFPVGSGIFLNESNNMGVGNMAPAYKLDVTGTLRATEVRNSGGVITSDPRMKLNLVSLSGADSWEIINAFRAKSFLYKPDFSVSFSTAAYNESGEELVTQHTQHWPLPQGIQIGYDADEVGETLPELVDIEPQSGVKYLNSGAIAPIVHQGTVWKINQLQQIIEQQQALIESLTARVEALENAA